MHWVMRLNPLSYVVAGLRRMVGGVVDAPGLWLPSLATSWLVAVVFLIATLVAAGWIVMRPAKGDLR